jgi:hypothetical protein
LTLGGAENGVEVGSLAYVPNSPNTYIRTKALQPHAHLTQKGYDAVIHITPKAFAKATKGNKRLALDGNILYARGGSVGEVGIVHDCGQATFSGHILKLGFAENPLYCYAFMKHPICKLQQQPKVKGSIRSLDNFNINTLLDCLIPFPNQNDADLIIEYVSALMQAVLDKEIAIHEKYDVIIERIDEELLSHQKNNTFAYAFPTKAQVITTSRLDASFWSEELTRTLFVVKNYSHGYAESIFKTTPPFKLRRGQNLQISAIGQGRYFDEPTKNAYPLATPADITDYMTISTFRYYGNPRKLNRVRHGEVLFAAKGIREVSIGHTYVHLSNDDFLTNIDSFLIDSGDINRNIFLACFLNYCKSKRVFAFLSDASNGGSFVENYFNYLPIPDFPEAKRNEIVRLYHNEATQPSDRRTLTNFVTWHHDWNANLGLWELDREMKRLQTDLLKTQLDIIEGNAVSLPF